MENIKAQLKKILPNIVLALFFIVGFSIFLYPFVSDFINDVSQSKEVNNYETKMLELSDNVYDEKIQEAQKYNEQLVGHTIQYNNENIEILNYNDILSISGTNLIGYLKISKINVKLPIYHGTDASVLKHGIGHLEGTSFPVPGETVHSVLSGHTGLPSSKLLTDLDKLEVGDTFNIIILNQNYTYQVDQILVVEPDEMDAIELVDGKNYCTLETCTPYGLNTHRLLVRGELTTNELITDTTINENNGIKIQYIILIILFLIIVIIFIIMIILRRRKNKKEESTNEESL